MFSDSSDSDDDSSKNSRSASINLLQQSPQRRSKTALPLSLQPLGHQATEKVQPQKKKPEGNDNNNSPSSSTNATGGGEQDVSPATQTINQLSQTNQSTSLHYDLSQLEHDVATTLVRGLPSKTQQRSSPQQQQEPKSSISKTTTATMATSSSSSRGKMPSENGPKNKNNTVVNKKPTAPDALSSSSSTTNRPPQAVEQQPFLEIDNFCFHQIDICEAGPLGLTITRCKPSDDLVQSLQQLHAATTTQGRNNKNNNMDSDDDDDDDDDATVDETRGVSAAKNAAPMPIEGLENASYVEVVRGSSLAERCGIKAGDWFVQNMMEGESNDNNNDDKISDDKKNKTIWFLFYDDVRTLARQHERPIQFILARRKPPAKKKGLAAAATAKKAAAAKLSVSFQQDPQSSKSKNKAATVLLLGRSTSLLERQQRNDESNTGRPQQQEAPTSVGLLKKTEKDVPNASGRSSDKPSVQSKAQNQAAPSSSKTNSDFKSGGTTSATTNTKTGSNKSTIAGSKKPAPAKKQAPTAKPAAKGTKPTDVVVRADDYVPFCIKCNNANKNKNDKSNKQRSHHAWCPKHGQFHNSGADEILERLRTGMRLGCPLCTKEFQSGRLEKSGSGGVKHTKSCLKSQQRLKSYSSASAKKQDSLAKKQKKAPSSSSAKGKRKSNDRTGQSTLQPRKKRKNEHVALDTSSSSSSSENEELHPSRIRKGRKTSSATTKRRALSSTRRANDFSDDSDDESMYMDEDSDGKRRPIQTLLAVKTNKRSRKDSRAAERSHQITPNETARVGHAQPKRRISTHANVADNTDDFDDDSKLDENEPPSTAWEADDNPWGPALGFMDGDVIIFAPQTDMIHCDAMLPSTRYQSDPFSANQQYHKTHQAPNEGFQVLVMKRDVMAMSSWGFSCYRHEFGGACLVKHVDPLSPADTCSFAGSSTNGNSGGTGSGLRPNDMIIAVNGKLVGGMLEVALDVELETAMREVLLVVSRYKFAHQGMDKIAEAERSYLAAVDDAMNDEYLLGWTDIGNRQTATSSRESRSVPLPKADSHEEAMDGNGHATTNKGTEPPSKDVGMIHPGAGSGGAIEDQKKRSANAKASLDKPNSTGEIESRQSRMATLPRDDSHTASALDRNQHSTTNEDSAVEQPAKNDDDNIPPGACHGDTGAPKKSFDSGQAADDNPSSCVETETTLPKRLQEGSSFRDSTESKECPATNARADSPNEMRNINSETHGGSLPSHRGSGRSSDDHPVADNSAPADKDLVVEKPSSALMQQSEEEQIESFDAQNVDTNRFQTTAVMEFAEASGDEDDTNASISSAVASHTDNPNDDDDEDDGNAWCGCVCGEVHKSDVPVYWIQCGACMTWYNVSRACVGFDCEHAGSLEHWECWACNDPDENEVESSNEQDADQSQQNADKALGPPIVYYDQQSHDRDSESVTGNRTDAESTTQPNIASKSSADHQTTVSDTAGNKISSDRFGPNGGMYPERTLRKNKNGTYARPHERRPAGYCWDEIRGVWVPQSEPSLLKHQGTNSKNIPKDGSAAAAKKRSTGKYIPDDRWTADGCVLPKSAPDQRADGTFVRPTGRIPKGFAWNEQRGVFAPKKENGTVAHPQSQSQHSQGSQLSSLRPGRSRRSQESAPSSSAGANDQARGIIDGNNNNNNNSEDEVFYKGDHVFIKEHAWPGVNNPEGIAVVLDSYIDEDGDRLYDVKYIIGRSKSLGILARFVSRHVF